MRTDLNLPEVVAKHCSRRQSLAGLESTGLPVGTGHNALRTAARLLEVLCLKHQVQASHSGIIMQMTEYAWACRKAYAAWYTSFGNYKPYAKRAIAAWRTIEQWTKVHHPNIHESLG